jgi:salicylate synthase
MTPRQQYRQTDVPAPYDPLPTVARLAAAHDGEPHVIHEQDDTWTFCAGAVAELTVDDTHVHYTCGADRRSVAWHDRPLDVLSRLLRDVPIDNWRAYGWAAFELAGTFPPDPTRTDGVRAGAARRTASEAATHQGAAQPLLHLLVPRDEVRISSGRALLRSTDPGALVRLAEALSRPPAVTRARGAATDIDLYCEGDRYRKMAADAVAEIADGLMEKAVLSRIVPVPYPVDLVATFVHGRRHNTPARSFLMDVGGLRAAGFSPEIVVSVGADRRVQTQPLAGTRARTSDSAENERLRADLLSHPKEIHEHRISVAAAIEELATVCEPGSISLDEDMVIKERGSVHHLASRISGLLAPGLNCWHAFAATFPAITASGVPKPKAIAAIRRHEQAARQIYGGAVLVVDSDGSLDAALVLRTVFEQSGKAWLRAGAGIVRQSDPAREMEETCEKLRSVSTYLVPSRRPAPATARPTP